ncbi:MAG: hypothetical protein KGL43_18585 [Burkholderiales bacterium]|nr:hypothetical protein [Burkholderiales bacterium]MDE2455600.1 hypothetical protein [Burkholderiales bacterium]
MSFPRRMLWAAAFIAAAASGVGVARWLAPRTIELPAARGAPPAEMAPLPAPPLLAQAH